MTPDLFSEQLAKIIMAADAYKKVESDEERRVLILAQLDELITIAVRATGVNVSLCLTPTLDLIKALAGLNLSARDPLLLSKSWEKGGRPPMSPRDASIRPWAAAVAEWFVRHGKSETMAAAEADKAIGRKDIVSKQITKWRRKYIATNPRNVNDLGAMRFRHLTSENLKGTPLENALYLASTMPK
jgi:hypothetical protein